MATDLFEIDPDRSHAVPKARDDVITRSHLSDIMNEQTGAEEVSAMIRQAYSPVVGLNKLRSIFTPQEDGFDILSESAKRVTEGLSSADYHRVHDSKSLAELRTRTSLLRQEKKDDATLSKVGLSQMLLMGMPMLAVDPLSIGAMGLTGKVLSGMGTTAFRRIGINSAAVGIEVGAVESVYRSTGSENYETVPLAAGMGMLFGMGASGLGEAVGKMASGSKERFLRDMENLGMNQDMPGPAQGSLREFYENAVSLPIRETKRAKDLADFGDTTPTGKQGQLFDTSLKWSTGGDREVPRYQPKATKSDTSVGSIKKGIRDSFMHYVKPPANPKRPTNLWKATTIISNRIGKVVSEMSYGKYDASDLVGEVLDDSMKVGNRSNSSTYGQSNNGGETYGTRNSANTVPDGIFITQKQAERIVNGKGSVRDFEVLEAAVNNRLGEFEISHNKYGGVDEPFHNKGQGPDDGKWIEYTSLISTDKTLTFSGRFSADRDYGIDFSKMTDREMFDHVNSNRITPFTIVSDKNGRSKAGDLIEIVGGDFWKGRYARIIGFDVKNSPIVMGEGGTIFTIEPQFKTKKVPAKQKMLGGERKFNESLNDSRIRMGQSLDEHVPGVRDITGDRFDSINELWMAAGKPRIETVKEVTGAPNASGAYHPMGAIQILSPKWFKTNGTKTYAEILQHEMVHAVVYNKARSDIGVRIHMQDLFDNVVAERKKMGRTKDWYGLKNPDEFISEVMSNQKFRDELRLIKYTDNSIEIPSGANMLQAAVFFMRKALVNAVEFGRLPINALEAADQVFLDIMEEGLNTPGLIKQENKTSNMFVYHDVKTKGDFYERIRGTQDPMDELRAMEMPDKLRSELEIDIAKWEHSDVGKPWDAPDEFELDGFLGKDNFPFSQKVQPEPIHIDRK